MQHCNRSLTSVAEVSDVEDYCSSGGVGCRLQGMLQSDAGVLAEAPVSQQDESLRSCCTCMQFSSLIRHLREESRIIEDYVGIGIYVGKTKAANQEVTRISALITSFMWNTVRLRAGQLLSWL